MRSIAVVRALEHSTGRVRGYLHTTMHTRGLSLSPTHFAARAPKSPPSSVQQAPAASITAPPSSNVIDNDDISSRFQKLTPREHVLHRPGMYIGSVLQLKSESWVVEGGVMVKRGMEHIPALLKALDEILVNACDNKSRDASMSRLDVKLEALDSARPVVTVRNDGAHIPVGVHPVERVHVPELLFGQLLTGSNFNDATARTVGGRHGYGAKLTNIFSLSFTVITYDAAGRRLYRQSWSRNMGDVSPPEILTGAAAEAAVKGMTGWGAGGYKGGDFTEVTFVPDLSRFGGGMAAVDAGTAALMQRRVWDAAGTLRGVAVTLNGKRVPVDGWKAYTALYTPRAATTTAGAAAAPHPAVAALATLAHAQNALGWDVSVGVAGMHGVEGDAAMYNSPGAVASFVNGMHTPRGGCHVDAVMEVLCRKCAAVLAKRHSDMAASITPAVIRAHVRLFVNAIVENPSFDSQAKEACTTPIQNVARSRHPGVDVATLLDLPSKFIAHVLDDIGVAGAVIATLQAKAQADAARAIRKSLKGNESKIKAIPKLEDANWAGTKRSHECTLILTEGDSAKALAVAGLSSVGRDAYGIFPLRGKLLNVRELSPAQAVTNAEVAALVSILGLDFKQTYAGLSPAARGLRYGRVMIMADQDVDGSHIKGLIINAFHTYWPQLLRSDGGAFLEQFITPLMKARKGSLVREFFNVTEYTTWRSERIAAGDASGWSIKYYKGLGTSTAAEAKAYFSDLPRHRRRFTWTGARDDDSILMAFAKGKTEERKQWLLTAAAADAHTLASRVGDATLPPLPASTTNAPTSDAVTFSDFVDHELIDFSRADLVRSIPSVLDGLKPSQRKVLYACFKRAGANATGAFGGEIKVAQLAGYVAEKTAYHHGEAALVNTIVGMAQDYVGSNNVPLLEPRGQFGTRLQGGKDAASARYIFTALSPAARLLFPAADDALLLRKQDDGDAVEPVVYIPVVPLLLINGAAGIGTGWSTYLPCHAAVDVIHAVESALAGTGASAIHPAWRGFTGSVKPAPGGYTISGAADWTHADGPAQPPSTSSGKRVKTRAQPAAPGTRGMATSVRATKASLAAASDGDSDDGDSSDAAGPHGESHVHIRELPVGRWTEDYKAFLLELVAAGTLRGIKEYHSHTSVDFYVHVAAQGARAIAREHNGDLLSFFRLTSSISTRNMHAFDAMGCIHKYASGAAIVDAFMPIRLALYHARRTRALHMLSEQAAVLDNKARFLQAVVCGALQLARPREAVVADLLRKDFQLFDATLSGVTPLSPAAPASAWAAAAHIVDASALVPPAIHTPSKLPHLRADTLPRGAYDYLLSMPMSALTTQAVERATKGAAEARAARAAAEASTAEGMWREDLRALREYVSGGSVAAAAAGQQ